MSTTEFCTQPFDANPDVSGLGILIAFYAQAIINFSVVAGYLVIIIFLPGHKRLQEWTGSMLLDLINNWIAVGIAMIIAAFSQWRTISTFHLFICSNLASTIPIFNPMGVGLIDPRSNRSRSVLQAAYFIFYGMLRLALSASLIYRLRFWGDTPGECFIIPHALPHIDVRLPLILGTTLRIVWDLSFTMMTLLWLIKAILRRGEIQVTAQEFLDDLKQKSAWIQMTYISIMCMINFLAPYVVPFIWNAYWTITIVLANRGHVLGDEYIFTFGQVGALVAFIASVYAIGSSYLQYREQKMNSSTSDPENLEENRPSEDPVTISRIRIPILFSTLTIQGREF